jgi:ABC-2 type transport system ATP-binding protein
MSVKIKELTKKYGEQTAVNNISLEIAKGKVLGFLGPNGAGKSTTMKMITGFLLPDSGIVEVCGIDVVQNPMEIKKKIGYLPESNPLYYDMYVKEYLAFIGGIHKIPLNKSLIPNLKTQIENCIESVGLGPEQHKKIGQLSKGYKQRVGLAAAILHNPEVLILDEPTGGLDPNQLVEIRALIKALGKEKTVILSTHIMQEVEAMCDRVAIINKGNLVANDTLENLKQSTNKKILKVGFEESLEQEWLRRLPAVESVEQTNDGYWLLTGSDMEGLRRQLLQLAAEQNLNISSLQTTGGSLEDIFRSLTAIQPS